MTEHPLRLVARAGRLNGLGGSRRNPLSTESKYWFLRPTILQRILLADCPKNATVTRKWVLIETTMNRHLKRIIAEAIEATPTARSAEIAQSIIARHRAVIEAWNLSNLTAAIDRALQRRRRVEREANPRQGWLPVPEFEKFQNIPAEVQEDTLEQYREAIAALERKIKFYANPRRSEKADAADKRQLREMKKLEPLIAPFFAGDSTMTVGRAVELYRQSLQTALADKNRKQASHAIKTRWARRTKNQ